MARFPLRLQFALAKARLFHGRTSIRYLRAEEILHPQSQQPVSHDAVRELIRDRHSIVWIAGSGPDGDPLAHPGIGHLTRLIAQRHFTFLETNAITLRQRIHEFQPLPRLYIVVRFLGTETAHDRRLAHPGAFRAAIEGIRAAQLSGFLICAKMDHSVGSPETAEVREGLRTLNLDGVMSTHSSLVPDSGWSRFLRAVEQARSMEDKSSQPQPAQSQVATADAEGCEEVAQAQ